MIDILDIFSWLPEKELSLDEIESIVLELHSVKTNQSGFTLETKLPIDANEYVTSTQTELLSEGKKVCFLLRDNTVIAAIGYK